MSTLSYVLNVGIGTGNRTSGTCKVVPQRYERDRRVVLSTRMYPIGWIGVDSPPIDGLGLVLLLCFVDRDWCRYDTSRLQKDGILRVLLYKYLLEIRKKTQKVMAYNVLRLIEISTDRRQSLLAIRQLAHLSQPLSGPGQRIFELQDLDLYNCKLGPE